MKKLPFLISIPHGGRLIPNELKTHSCITDKDLFDDSDCYTQEIYKTNELVESQIVFPIARAFIDVNRARKDLPPQNTDGVIKSATCYNRAIYKKGYKPDSILKESILALYYDTFHASIKESLERKDTMIAFDCHSMAETAPTIAPDKGKRPLFNLGDADGTACDPEITRLLKESIIHVFNLPEHEVALNKPFKGGYITKTYGNNPKPWIQIEMNRRLYLRKPWFDDSNLSVSEERLYLLNEMFRSVLILFFNKLKLKILL